MTWHKFQSDAFGLTEQEIQDFIPFIVDNYSQAIKDINKELRKVYTNILSGINPADYYNEMLKYDRLTKLLETVTRQYAAYSREVGKLTGQSGEIAMSNNFYRMQYTHKWLVPGLDFAILPDELIQISVYGSSSAYKSYQKSILSKIYGSANNYYPQAGTLSEFLAANRGKEIANIERAITQGLLRGHSYTKTAREVKKVIGEVLKKNGDVFMSGAMANATRIVRTESTRIMNDAALINTEYARSEGVDVVRFWNATLDGRTRPTHRRLDDKPEDENGKWLGGTVSGPGRGPTVSFNANCRCTTFESVNGSKPTLRRGRNPVTGKNEVFSYKSFDQWAQDNGLKKNKFGEYVVK